ncbi:hypothetical protein ACFLZO_00195 [Patescibacteria group bacterium]
MAHTLEKEREAVKGAADPVIAPEPEAGSLADIAPSEVDMKNIENTKQQATPEVKWKMRKELRRGLAAVSYLNVLFLLPLFFPVKDEFVDFHLRQGIALFAIGTIVSFVAWGSFFAWLGTGLAVGAVAIFASVQAAQGKRWKMPILGVVAKKITLD